MGISLQDQLLKAGLIDSHKAKTVRTQKKKQKRSGKKSEEVVAKELADKAQHEKQLRDRELNLQKQEQAKQKEIMAQVALMIEQNQIDLQDGEIAYNFQDQNLLKKIYVNSEVQQQLSQGLLAIVKNNANYAVVAADIAEKIQQRHPESVIMRNRKEDKSAQEDEYAGYEVPDDLTW